MLVVTVIFTTFIERDINRFIIIIIINNNMDGLSSA